MTLTRFPCCDPGPFRKRWGALNFRLPRIEAESVNRWGVCEAVYASGLVPTGNQQETKVTHLLGQVEQMHVARVSLEPHAGDTNLENTRSAKNAKGRQSRD